MKQLEDDFQCESQRREWLSTEREKLIVMADDLKMNLEQECTQKELEQRKNIMLEKEIQQQKEYLSRELSNKTDTNTGLCRQIDQLRAELKKFQSQYEYTNEVK